LNPLSCFKKIFVEITNRCNLSCAFCAAGERPKGDMAPAAFAALLPQLRPFTGHLCLHVLGEPLLHPALGELLAHCHAQGFRVNLTTNGTLLPRHGEMLLAAPALRQVNISLHSMGERVGGDDLERYLAGVLAFAHEAGASGIQVSLRIWDLLGQGDEGGKRRQERVLTGLEKFFALPVPLADAVMTGQGRKLAPGIFLSQKELFAWPTLSGPDQGGQGYCLGLRDQAAILTDGTVVPCCLDAQGATALGNVFQQPFASIIAGERAAQLRRGFSRRKVVEALCRRCSYRLRF
jgi:radical SAM protein with 4Fe4S-binding SPASM domain